MHPPGDQCAVIVCVAHAAQSSTPDFVRSQQVWARLAKLDRNLEIQFEPFRGQARDAEHWARELVARVRFFTVPQGIDHAPSSMD